MTSSSGFHMADVRRKRPSERRAVAIGELRAGPVGYAALADKTLPRGDTLAMAQAAGLQGAKHASQLMPLCHPLSLEYVDVRCVPPLRASGCVPVPERYVIRVYCEASLGPCDLAPEALALVTTRTVPGLAEPFRSASSAHTPLAWLSRAECWWVRAPWWSVCPAAPRRPRRGWRSSRRSYRMRWPSCGEVRTHEDDDRH